MAYKPRFERPEKENRPSRKTNKNKRLLQAKPDSDSDTIRLNKYISRAGICSRRDADELIKKGEVKVNGAVITEMGYQVQINDEVSVKGSIIQPENFVYVLLNKPSNTITSTDDEKGRQTVMDLVESGTGYRLYPVGRLDRNTTGLILLTNDGDLANRLMHPRYKIGKVYEATCNRALNDDELAQLRKGVDLEDGLAKAYKVERSALREHTVIISVHEGRNHLVRRMIAALEAEVTKLKRIQYAGLYLEKLRMGRWRFLKPAEINQLRAGVKLPELRFTKK